jgi:hypothetical protein
MTAQTALADYTTDAPNLEPLTDAERAIYRAVVIDGESVRSYQRDQGWSSPGTAANLLDRARSRLGENQ